MSRFDDLLTTYRVQRVTGCALWAVIEVGTLQLVDIYESLNEANNAMIRLNNRLCPGAKEIQ